MNTSEYQSYQEIKPFEKIDDLDKLMAEIKPHGHLFSYGYKLVREQCLKLPNRKDGSPSFTHPLNVAYALQQAGVTDETTLTAGLMHDYVEEEVDLFKRRNNIREDKRGISRLDRYEGRVLRETEKGLVALCTTKKIPREKADYIIGTLRLVTRHKRDFYYGSISNIFECEDEILRKKGILVKNGDGLDNLSSIKIFNSSDRLFRCFKAVFVLNNTKKYLLEDPGNRFSQPEEDALPTEWLFKKFAKATYGAFSTVRKMSTEKGIGEVIPLLQLAFKKFTREQKGTKEVTEIDWNETHPVRLYQGVVRKYDARLHHEWKKFGRLQREEQEYCYKFFNDHKFSDEQIDAIIDYKDAYSFSEVVADLLYEPNYIISRFLSSDLTEDAKIPLHSPKTVK